MRKEVLEIVNRLSPNEGRTNEGKTFIVCAANRDNENGSIYVAPRHGCKPMWEQVIFTVGQEKFDNGYAAYLEEGFIDNYENFYTRKEAAYIAKYMSQVRYPNFGAVSFYDRNELYSENLYDEKRYVVSAAKRDANGLIICGARHGSYLMHRRIDEILGFPRLTIDKETDKITDEKTDEQFKQKTEYFKSLEDGFIDSFYTFLTRKEAGELALENSQLRYPKAHGDFFTRKELHSEHLY